jgi:peptidoglycan/xylan/chitin deacetylase (PgdA/CDA1 family)
VRSRWSGVTARLSRPSRFLLLGVALLGLLATTAVAVLVNDAGTRHARSKPAAATSAAPVPSVPSPSPSQNPFLTRVPLFPPAPPPVRLTLLTGPYAPIYRRLPVNARVAFLTIDDGWIRQPQAITLMAAAHIPFTMFLVAPVAAADPAFFTRMETVGGVVEDHTVTHRSMRGKPYPFQRAEICGGASMLAKTFGRRPEFFRPPFGEYDSTTLRAVHDCGLTAAFYWSETVNNGTVNYQTSLHRISPGDIILMHFRQSFVADALAALTAIHQAGLTPALLEDYLG